MIFSSVPALFAKMNLETYDNLSTLRKEETRKRLDFFYDDQLDHVYQELEKSFSEPEKFQLACLNITKKIIKNLAQTYTTPPKRTLDGSDSDKELYQTITEECSLDVKMKQASRLVKLLKTILIRPVWRNGKIDLDILTGDIVDVETGDTPEDLIKVLVTNYGNSNKIDDVTYSYWTKDLYQKLDHRGNILEESKNPYGVIPFIPIWDYSPHSDFWLPGGDDLISLQEAVNNKLVDLLHLMRFQSFGVGWIKGTTGGGFQRLDAGSLVELPENGELGFESQQAKITEVLDAIDRLIKWAGLSNGLSSDFIKQSSTQESGLSKLVSNKELEELRRDDIELFRKYEKSLFELIKKIWNTHNTKKLSEACSLALDFDDGEGVTTPKEQAETWQILMTLGVASPVDVVMERNPDLATREDALAYLMTIKQELTTLQGVY